MNQFANIGSMFPGAQNKALRDNAKLALTLPGQPEIIGLVIKNAMGDITVVERDKTQVVSRDQVAMSDINERDRALQITQIERAYWEKICEEDPGGYGIEGMGACANIIAAIVMGLSPEEFKKIKKKKEKNENTPTDNQPG